MTKERVSCTPVCRYYIRYLQPWNTDRMVDEDAEKYWLPVDLYVGERAALVCLEEPIVTVHESQL